MNRYHRVLAVASWITFVSLAVTNLASQLRAEEVAPKPTVWISPPGQDHGQCVRELFDHPEQWEKARAAVDVFFQAGHFLDRNFSDDELRRYFALLRQWKIKFALEVGAIKPFSATGEKTFNSERRAWDRFGRLGGECYAIALDEPLVSTHLSMHKPDDYAVQETANYIALVRKHYPQMLVGDIEAYPSLSYAVLVEWIDSLQAKLKEMHVRGLDFFRLDVDSCHFLFGNGNWAEVKKLENACRRRKLRFSLIYWAAGQPRMKQLGLASDSTWYIGMMHQGYAYAFVGGAPDEDVIESWIGAPAHSVPENAPWTFTRSVLDFTQTFVHRGK